MGSVLGLLAWCQNALTESYSKFDLQLLSACISMFYCLSRFVTEIHKCKHLTASLAKWLRRPPRERKIHGSNLACAGIFSGLSHTSDFKIGTPVATLPGAWRYRVSTGTGRPSVSILTG